MVESFHKTVNNNSNLAFVRRRMFRRNDPPDVDLPRSWRALKVRGGPAIFVILALVVCAGLVYTFRPMTELHPSDTQD